VKYKNIIQVHNDMTNKSTSKNRNAEKCEIQRGHGKWKELLINAYFN